MDKSPTKKCPQCQSDIPALAKKCSHCRSNQPQHVSARTAVWIIVVIILFLTISIIASVNTPTTTKTVEEEVPTSFDAQVVSQTNIKNLLKSPSTAKFCRPNVEDLGEGRYIVNSCVDSQNSFGAMIRSNWQVTLTYAGPLPASSQSWVFEKIVFDGEVVHDLGLE